jgi:ATP-dependent DNA ligase
MKNAVHDGEIVCLDANEVSQFNQLFSYKSELAFFH